MPDPLAQSLSATETPALFNASPYCTRWMLYQKFARGRDIERPQSDRMYWGKALQPLVLQKAAQDLALEITPTDQYDSRPRYRLGCTRDARIYDPSRGWGSLETKCVFDYGVWMREWGGGKIVPRHYEIQLQQQMLIGEPEAPHAWGVIGAWVCGEMHYFERKPLEAFWSELVAASDEFFRDVEAAREPAPFGDPQELPLLAELFDPEPGAVLARSEDWKLAEVARMHPEFSEQARFYSKAAEATRAQLIAAGRRDGQAYEEVQLPGQISYTLKANKLGHIRLKVSVPDQLPDEIMEVDR